MSTFMAAALGAGGHAAPETRDPNPHGPSRLSQRRPSGDDGLGSTPRPEHRRGRHDTHLLCKGHPRGGPVFKGRTNPPGHSLTWPLLQEGRGETLRRVPRTVRKGVDLITDTRRVASANREEEGCRAVHARGMSRNDTRQESYPDRSARRPRHSVLRNEAQALQDEISSKSLGRITSQHLCVLGAVHGRGS